MSISSIKKALKNVFQGKLKNLVSLADDSTLDNHLKPLKIGDKTTNIELSESELKVTGTINAESINVDGSAVVTATLTDEQVQDIVGAMFSGNTETRITATYQIANKYGVNAADLVGFDTPQQMERYAAALSQTNKVVQDNTPKFNTSGDVPPDNIPSNDDDIIDSFARGDPKITTEMYEGAMRRLNPNWHG